MDQILEKEQDTEELASLFATQFFRMHRLMDRRLGQQGVSLARFKFLMFLKKEGTSRAADMADLLALAPRTVTEGLDGLERDGLVRRDPDPNDRRAKQVSLTAEGARAVTAIEPLRDEMLGRILGTLSDRDRADLRRVFQRIDSNLSREEQLMGVLPGLTC
jgi:DNA-binding MarR family transcriptional regulator